MESELFFVKHNAGQSTWAIMELRKKHNLKMLDIMSSIIRC